MNLEYFMIQIIQDFRRWLETTDFDLTCDSPKHLREKSFRSLDIEDLICEELEDLDAEESNGDLDVTSIQGVGGDEGVSTGDFVCPDRCNCDDELKHVNCENQGYTSPPPVLKPATKLLDLRRNKYSKPNHYLGLGKFFWASCSVLKKV